MPQSENIEALAAALCAVQATDLEAAKAAKNPGFKKDGKESKYADLEAVWDAIREPLTQNGLSVAQPLNYLIDGNGNLVTLLETLLMHSSGQWVSGMMPLMLRDLTPQAQGSAITYARRYAVCAMLGVVQVDDDGNSAKAAPKKSNPPLSTGPPPAPKQSLDTDAGTTTKASAPNASPSDANAFITAAEREELLVFGKSKGWPKATILEYLQFKFKTTFKITNEQFAAAQDYFENYTPGGDPK